LDRKLTGCWIATGAIGSGAQTSGKPISALAAPRGKRLTIAVSRQVETDSRKENMSGTAAFGDKRPRRVKVLGEQRGKFAVSVFTVEYR